jgi:phosphatidate phosphatase APP1
MTSNYDGNEELPAGSKRARLRGFIRAADDMRRSYVESYSASGWSQRGGNGLDDFQDGMAGGYPDAAVVTSGDEQMILFPSYARKHVKQRETKPKPTLENPAEGTEGDFMKQQWEEYKEDNAVVDVDVRGWVFSPHRGQMTRRQRVFISLARQLAGLPSPAQPSPTGSAIPSRDASPHAAHRQRREDEEAARQAEELVRKGEREADAATRGEYSEGMPHTTDHTSGSDQLRRLAASNASDMAKLNPLDRRAAWNHPADMTPDELHAANAHLMARLAPFMSNPLADTPISAFFYNDEVSRQRTIYTSSYGHFALRASLDFVPTHVRILASEKLSATEEIIITPARGVSLISDVDDTIKHSAISSGAREIFRNAFIRELGDLNIDGVVDWYTKLSKLGVKFHYVSNSPWQLFPVLQKYFSMSGLPPGSFHLKQYSGMLQGIFEPVAERKKGTLDRIAGDFPERKFILVGDSGEADLEVYLDFVAENPGRVLGIFIRDVTTPQKSGFFDSSMGPLTGPRSSSSSKQGTNGTSASTWGFSEDEDPELKAAIAASLKTLEEEETRNRPRLPTRRPTDPAAPERSRAAAQTEDLIDLSDDPPTSTASPALVSRSMSTYTIPPTQRKTSTANGAAKAPPPSVPRKPQNLQSKASPSTTPASEAPPQRKTAPPPPPTRRSTANINTTHKAAPPTPSDFQKPALNRQNSPAASIASAATTSSYREAARQKLSSAYNALPAAPWNTGYVHTELSRGPSPNTGGGGRGIPGPAAVGRGLSNSWQTYNDPGRLNGPEQSVAARPYSTNAGGGDTYRNGGQTQGQPINKRLELWAQRWVRAQEYCRERGVVLRSWRVGGDVVGECLRLVERANSEAKGGTLEEKNTKWKDARGDQVKW